MPNPDDDFAPGAPTQPETIDHFLNGLPEGEGDDTLSGPADEDLTDFDDGAGLLPPDELDDIEDDWADYDEEDDEQLADDILTELDEDDDPEADRDIPDDFNPLED